MLAYVFWHWPRQEASREEYERLLIEFHQVLSSYPPEGFQRSLTFRVGESPWLPSRAGAYQDWYLLRNSCALDALNDAAVASPCRASHDAVARLAEGGTGGLYRWRLGETDLPPSAHSLWFDKPGGMSYGQLFDRMQPACEEQGAGLWGRQMVLGPAPEFCLLSPKPFSLPLPVESSGIRMEGVGEMLGNPTISL